MTRPIHLAPLDEHGQPLPPIEPASDVAQLLYLLEVARVRGYRIGPTIRLGSLITTVHDLRQSEGRPTAAVEGPDIWKMAGHEDGDE